MLKVLILVFLLQKLLISSEKVEKKTTTDPYEPFLSIGNKVFSPTWQDDEIIRRWQQLFSLPVLIERY